MICLLIIIIVVILLASILSLLYNNINFIGRITYNTDILLNTTKVIEEGNYRLYFYKNNELLSSMELKDRTNKNYNYSDNCEIYYYFRYDSNEYIFVVNTEYKIAKLIKNNIIIFTKNIIIKNSKELDILN